MYSRTPSNHLSVVCKGKEKREKSGQATYVTRKRLNPTKDSWKCRLLRKLSRKVFRGLQGHAILRSARLATVGVIVPSLLGCIPLRNALLISHKRFIGISVIEPPKLEFVG